MGKRYPKRWASPGVADRDLRCAYCLMDLALADRPVQAVIGSARYCSRGCATAADEYQLQVDARRAALMKRGRDVV
jgi:hypothetical protein